MANVDLAATAVEDLDRLILPHSLPPDTRKRVRGSLKLLEQFPRLGAELPGRWQGFHFVLGPWRWMIIVYVFLEAEDRIVVVTLHDGRSSAAATAQRGR